MSDGNLPVRRGGEAEIAAVGEGGGGEGECVKWALPGLEFSMDAGPLRDLDPEKLKNEIRKWAKAVVAYARQLSGSFGGSSSEDT